MSRATNTWQEMAARGRQLAIEQGIDPDALRPTDSEEVGAEFLREHTPSLVVIGNEVMLTWTWDAVSDDAAPEWWDCPEDQEENNNGISPM